MAEPKLQNSKKRVLIIGPTPPPNHGVSIATRSLLESNLNESFSLLHLDTADRRGIEHVDKPDLHDLFLFLKQWFQLIRILITKRPEITYLPISQSTIGFLRDSQFIWPAYLFKSRVILHLHGGNFRSWFESRTIFNKAYIRTVLNRISLILILGESFRSIFRELVPDRKIMVVPNGIDWPATDVMLENRQKFLKDKFRVLFVGTLSRLKGVHLLLSSIRGVIEKRKNVEFIFAGKWYSDADRQIGERIIKENEIQPYLKFIGEVNGRDKFAAYQNADLFVFPSIQQEGQPLVVIEAMASGLAILYSNRGCLKETVIPDEMGVEFEPENINELTDKIIRLSDDSKKLARMGIQSRLRYEKFYTLEQFTEKIARAFEFDSRKGFYSALTRLDKDRKSVG